MIEQNELRRKIGFRISPLLDLALSALVLMSPERFAAAAGWAARVTPRLPQEQWDRLRLRIEEVDLFDLALELEAGPLLPVPDALRSLSQRDPELSELLLAHWSAISPEVAAVAGLLAESIRREGELLERMDPAAYIARFTDRVTVAGDGGALLMHWGQGMRVAVGDLDRILFVPSAFCPRRLMFYRAGATQLFFYDPMRDVVPAEVEEAPESLVLGFSALADLTRLRLLRLIALESMPAQEMARRLELNESTVSRHLRLMVEAGLVGRERQEGKFVFYVLQAKRIDELSAMMLAYLGRERT